MPQPIQLNRTTTGNPPPAPLLVGEAAVCVAPGLTRLWIGDGTANRLLLTSDPQDALGQGLVLGNFLPLTGGQMSGAIELLPPQNGPDAANKAYVDGMVTSVTAYLGTWSVAANTPSISGGGTAAGQFYIATTVDPAVPETVPVGVPGIAGQVVSNGDWIIWNAGTGVWQIIAGGPLTQQVADALYVQQTGDTMTGPLILTNQPTANNAAATQGFVNNLVALFLPLAGGTMAGGITMPGTYVPQNPPDVATKEYVDSGSGFLGLVLAPGSGLNGAGTVASPLDLVIVDGGTF